ncbi:elongation factor 4 [Candidatus Microgenomates bacterium]|nr:elongation factor 4 [Candidatus Microgenomates bacterium]
MEKNQIRNFAIIAHIDHGKSTLADRLLEFTGAVSQRIMQEQFLDQNPISRERGITIKLAPVRLLYKYRQKEYELNMIDTPGHVDFSYEVSRSLSSCEGTILLVDATQGIQAQTLAHGKLAQSLGLTIIPVLNKVDLPQARIEEVTADLSEVFGFSPDEIFTISAKTGAGVDNVLEKIITRIPPPDGGENNRLRALIFDSIYDEHQGIIAYVKIADGKIESKEKDRFRLKFLATKTENNFLEIGYFTPERTVSSTLSTGEVGFIATGLKDPTKVRIGDTITVINKDFPLPSNFSPLPGYQELKPMVFFGFFPKSGNDFERLKVALEKLHLNDSSFSYSPESSKALGNGFRLGFLGLLHGEIIKERLFREFNLDLIATTPNVEYQCLINNNLIEIKNIDDIPPLYTELREPWMKLVIFTPENYVGSIITLCQEKRAVMSDMIYHQQQHTEMHWEMPLSEMIINFYDRLKSVSSGFANLDYSFWDFRKFEGKKLTVLINQEPVDALSVIVAKEKMDYYARVMAQKLKSIIDRQQFEVRIQIANNGKILASETVSPFRKDVIQKLYGGDRTRKDKLLEAQKKGKKKMKQIGKISLPDDVFVSFYKI